MFHLKSPKVSLSSIQFFANPLYTANFSMVVFNGTGVTKMNVTGTQLVDFKKVSLLFNLAGKSNEDYKNFDKEIYKGYFDVCKFSQGILGSFVARAMTENLHDYSNFKLECPQKKGFIYVYNLPMDGDRHYPSMIFQNFGSWELTVELKAKIEKVRAIATIVTVKMYGRV